MSQGEGNNRSIPTDNTTPAGGGTTDTHGDVSGDAHQDISRIKRIKRTTPESEEGTPGRIDLARYRLTEAGWAEWARVTNACTSPDEDDDAWDEIDHQASLRRMRLARRRRERLRAKRWARVLRRYWRWLRPVVIDLLAEDIGSTVADCLHQTNGGGRNG